MSEADRKVLEGWQRMPTLSQALGLRAQVVLASTQGETVRALASRLKISPNTVAACRRRYRQGGVNALRTKPRSGRPSKITRAKEQAVVAATPVPIFCAVFPPRRLTTRRSGRYPVRRSLSTIRDLIPVPP